MIIQAKGLTKVFGSKIAVNHIDLSIKQGNLTAILGPNGAGKTTTISMLTGLLSPTSGIIEHHPGAKISMVFQQSILDNNLSVYENLIIRNRMYHSAAENRLDSLIQQVGLTAFINQKYGHLSGGQKRRVDIARALINQPDVLFLDEPTTGLDIQTREAIWQLLHELQKTECLTIVLTTHYLEEADHANAVYIVDHGSIIAKGAAEDVKRQYSRNQLTLNMNGSSSISTKLPEAARFDQQTDSIVYFPATTAEAIDLLAKFRDQIKSFEYRQGTMNDAFLNLTGREMR
ncbi:ABC transporter ATP-binding protein [Lentilactobacillus kisonensis]|nr:ABC transporter ATP-binding protein [Lentilactobacillus kisonensis]